jgi:hypothetical protein
MLNAADILLSPEEIAAITNGLTQPAAQLRELHKQGFTRACRPRGGPVVLYRAHFEAVAAHRDATVAAQEQNARSGPNIVGLDQWAKKRKHGTQAQGR